MSDDRYDNELSVQRALDAQEARFERQIERLERELAERTNERNQYMRAATIAETERDAALARAEQLAKELRDCELIADRSLNFTNDKAIIEYAANWRYVKSRVLAALSAPPSDAAQGRQRPPPPWTHCLAGRDGEGCQPGDPPGCPQLRDNEPHATGRHCPLDTREEEGAASDAGGAP